MTVTVQWYLKEEQPFVSATWQCMLGLNNCIMGLLGVSTPRSRSLRYMSTTNDQFGFFHVERSAGLRGWQWMTIAIAIFSFFSSVIILVFLPDSPTQARWASDDDKIRFVERVRSNNQGQLSAAGVKL